MSAQLEDLCLEAVRQNGMALELLGKRAVSGIGLGHDDHARGVLIQPMNQSRPLAAADAREAAPACR